VPSRPPPRTDDRTALRADCSRCAGLCCVAPPFAASADFAFDKPAGAPCRHLQEDFRCGIHDRLRAEGFPGCTVFDCFGAGQRITQQTFGGRSWREAPELAGAQFAVLPVVRQLHEMLWYLTEALALPGAAPLHRDLAALLDRTEALADGTPDELAALDVGPHRNDVGGLLQRVSERARGPQRGPDRRGADLAGRDLRGADLRRSSLRGALLIGADLRGTDLSTCLFLTQPQVSAARGDAATAVPAVLSRPAHWGPAASGHRTRQVRQA
jgi:hypothetical protein